MDFYKKIVKSKDSASVLSEKEYKCASLQAIANEAIKENNKKSLKELVEEINGHLADLRAIKDDKDAKNRDKCASLIKKFEDCLVKIVGNGFPNLLSSINEKLRGIEDQVNLNIRNKDLEELKKVAERIERNIGVIKEIPEVKKAINSENGDEKILDVVNKFTNLQAKVLSHINEIKRYRISSPILLETTQNLGLDDNLISQQPTIPIKKINPSPQEVPPPIPNKIAASEVEEKLKLMRQKRLNRLSTFVDQQTKLAEERGGENSLKTPIIPNKSFDDLSRISEKMEPEDVIIKPSLYKAAAQKRLVKTNEERGKGGILAGSNDITFITSKLQVPGPTANAPLNEPPKKSPNNTIKQTSFSSGDITSVNKINFPKNDLTRSFAERQIENAKNQNEKVQLKSSNSTKTTPPRTPTQIRKIFSSFNACVMGANNKSIEDLPAELKNPSEQQLKNFQFKNTGLSSQTKGEEKSSQSRITRSGSFKEKGMPENIGKVIGMENDLPPPVPPKIKKPIAIARRNVTTQQRTDGYEVEKVNEQLLSIPNPIIKSASQTQVSLPTISQETAITKPWRSSLDNDPVVVRHNESDFIKQEPTDCTITIKRSSSNTQEPPAERYSFSTFRTSTESVKDEYNIDNPLYGIVGTSTKLSRQNSISIDSMLIAAKTKELKTLESGFGGTWKRSRRPSYRRELSSEANRFIALEPVITKLEYIVQEFMGLKRDEDYSFIDKLLSKYYVKVDEVPVISSFDEIEKSNLLERLTKASRDLEHKVVRNENLLALVIREQVELIGGKYGIA